MMAEQQGLDGLGFLSLAQPAPVSFALVRAKLQTEQGITEQHVLVLATANGAHVTYWSREALVQLRDKLTEELSGITIASALPTNGSERN